MVKVSEWVEFNAHGLTRHNIGHLGLGGGDGERCCKLLRRLTFVDQLAIQTRHTLKGVGYTKKTISMWKPLKQSTVSWIGLLKCYTSSKLLSRYRHSIASWLAIMFIFEGLKSENVPIHLLFRNLASVYFPGFWIWGVNRVSGGVNI